MRYCQISEMLGCFDNEQKTMKLSKVIKVAGKYPSDAKSFTFFTKFGSVREMLELPTESMTLYQGPEGIWKHRGIIGSTAGYCKWQDRIAGIETYEIELGFK